MGLVAHSTTEYLAVGVHGFAAQVGRAVVRHVHEAGCFMGKVYIRHYNFDTNRDCESAYTPSTENLCRLAIVLGRDGKLGNVYYDAKGLYPAVDIIKES